MRVTSFLPHLKSIKVENVAVADHSIILRVAATHKRAQCPLCQRWFKRIHSRYWRTIADQPWSGRPVAIRLRVRRFFCLNGRCPRRIFAERLPALVDPYGRRSQPLRAALRRVGLAIGARAGARLAVPLGMPISARSLLRVIHSAPLPTAELARVIAIDDWAWRKGQRYGTVIVDLERRRPIDLLPDRAAETVVAWLQAHPRVAVIARDRGGMYIDGATRGAPDAIQVVDRWHMAKNLGEALERLFARKHDALVAMAREVARTETAETAGADATPASMPRAVPRGTRAQRDRADSAHRRAARLERFMTVRNLSAQGLGQMAIAAMVGLSHHTVKRYLQATAFPERAPRTTHHADLLDPYKPYLRRRWSEGCRNGLQLFREIQEQAYTSSRANVARFVTRLRHDDPPPPSSSTRPHPHRAVAPCVRPPTPRELAALILRRPDDLTVTQRTILERVHHADDELARADALGQGFMRLLRERRGAEFDAWIAEVRCSAVPEVQAFADGLTTDRAAVVAGLTLPWSTGPAEGQITKLNDQASNVRAGGGRVPPPAHALRGVSGAPVIVIRAQSEDDQGGGDDYAHQEGRTETGERADGACSARSTPDGATDGGHHTIARRARVRVDRGGQCLLAGGPCRRNPTDAAPATPLEEAQEVIYQALEAQGKRRLDLARSADDLTGLRRRLRAPG